MSAAVARKKRAQPDSSERMLALRDAISRLVDERDELYRHGQQQAAQIVKLRQRCQVLEQKRSDARGRIEHLMQQLPQ